MLAASLAALALVYAAGVVRVWRHAGYGRGIRWFDVLAFAAGWLALVVALSPPLDHLSEEWLVAHMIQHELLMVIAAPLIAISSPMVAALWAVPSTARHTIVDAVRRGVISRAWASLTAPVTVFLLYALALWVWHMPALYDAALAHEGIHILQHVCFFGTATLFWWGIAHGRYGRVGYGAAVVYVFATAVHSGVLGALLTFSADVWYVPYESHHHAATTALEDQQLAGLLMWIPAGFTFVAGGLILFAAWLRESDKHTRYETAVSAASSEIR
jgi:cytochrome c oxidase assembly factor CtaG